MSDFVGVTGWYDIVPFYAFVIGAFACAALATAIRPTRSDSVVGAAALTAWVVVALAAPWLLTNDRPGGLASAVLVVVLAASVVVAVFALAKSLRRRVLGTLKEP